MVKIYQYKIQWIFNIGNQEGLKDVNSIFKTINPKSLDVINFLDSDYKCVYNTTDFMMWQLDNAPKKMMKQIKEVLKKYPNVRFVELYRK
jgi:hypothetical protein